MTNVQAFPKLTNDRILRAARGLPTDVVPVWIMRQAGRYLPEFRELRKQHAFFEICESPELACEVTLMPIRRFDLDAAIIFSDILVIPQALGMTVEMTSEGPKFPQPLDIHDDNFALSLKPDVNVAERLKYVYQAITITRHALEGKCPLIGFSGAPWTLMCYMIEGGGSKTMSKAKKALYQKTESSHMLLSMIADKVTDHLVEQAKAGAQLVQLFESNAEYLTVDLFMKYAFPYIKRICDQFKAKLIELNIDYVPIVVFAKGGHYALELLDTVESIDVLGLDWTIDPRKAQKLTSKCLQGNLDPCAMYAQAGDVRAMVGMMLERFGTHGYIANLGHGIYPDAKMECVKEFVDAVHELSCKD